MKESSCESLIAFPLGPDVGLGPQGWFHERRSSGRWRVGDLIMEVLVLVMVRFRVQSCFLWLFKMILQTMYIYIYILYRIHMYLYYILYTIYRYIYILYTFFFEHVSHQWYNILMNWFSAAHCIHPCMQKLRHVHPFVTPWAFRTSFLCH